MLTSSSHNELQNYYSQEACCTVATQTDSSIFKIIPSQTSAHGHFLQYLAQTANISSFSHRQHPNQHSALRM